MKNILLLVFLLLCFLLASNYCIYAQDVIYTNHVGLYKVVKNAEQMKNRLEDNGFEVYITETPPYRVTVGRSINLHEALAIKNKLNKLKFDCYIIEIWREYIPAVEEEDVSPIAKEEQQTILGNSNKRKSKLIENQVEEQEDNIVEEKNVIKEVAAEELMVDYNADPLQEISTFPLVSDSILKGMFGSQTLFFLFNENWEVSGDNYLNLKYSYNQTSENTDSSVTVYFNDNPIYGFNLAGNKTDEQTLKIDLPENMIRKGFNNIKIFVYKGSEQGQANTYNPAAWFKIEETTAIQLNYKEISENFRLDHYPYPFLKVGSVKPVDSVFVIPDKYTKDHLTALAYLAAGFGRREPYENLNIKVITPDQLEEYQSNNLIFVGDSIDFPDVEGLAASSKDQSIIQLYDSPWEESGKIMQLSSPADKLDELARLLFFDRVVAQMKREKQLINDFNKKLNDNVCLGEKVTFKELGYDNVNLNGLYQLKALYNYQLPAGRQLTKGAYLDLKFRYSQAINFRDSSVIVKVNDLPVASKNISKDRANGDGLICEFPEELLNKQIFNIEVQFLLSEQQISGNTWAFVSNESFLSTPYHNVNNADLGEFPYLFFQDGSLQDLVLVLSNQPDVYDINIMASMFAYMGRLATDIKDIYVIKAKDLINDLKDKDIIMLGSPGDNPIIKEVNRYLPVKFNQDFSNFISTEEYFFLKEVGLESGIVQIIDSIWNPERVIMVASALNKWALRNTELLLSSIDITPQLSGKVSMMDDFGEIYTFKEQDVDAKSKTKDYRQELKNFMQRNLRDIAVLGIMFCLMVIVVFFVLYFIRAKKKLKIKGVRENE